MFVLWINDYSIGPIAPLFGCAWRKRWNRILISIYKQSIRVCCWGYHCQNNLREIYISSICCNGRLFNECIRHFVWSILKLIAPRNLCLLLLCGMRISRNIFKLIFIRMLQRVKHCDVASGSPRVLWDWRSYRPIRRILVRAQQSNDGWHWLFAGHLFLFLSAYAWAWSPSSPIIKQQWSESNTPEYRPIYDQFGFLFYNWTVMFIRRLDKLICRVK